MDSSCVVWSKVPVNKLAMDQEAAVDARKQTWLGLSHYEALLLRLWSTLPEGRQKPLRISHRVVFACYA